MGFLGLHRGDSCVMVRVKGERAVTINELPLTDLASVLPGCNCPVIDPAAWDKKAFNFHDKLFVQVRTANIVHVPLNMGSVFRRTYAAIKVADALPSDFAILSDDHSLWRGTHYFAVTKDVPGLTHVRLTGNFVTRVFDGPYRDAYIWVREMREDIALMGHRSGRLFFYYTTCPTCAETRGTNYVVAFGEVL